MREEIYRNLALIVLTSFTFASVMNTFIAHYAFRIQSFQKLPPSLTFARLSIPSFDNSKALVMEKSILKRNLFNSLGPIEEEMLGKNQEIDFTKVPCTKEALPFEVVGTIFSTEPTHCIVSLKDPKVQEADSYKVGEQVIDKPEYEVYKILQGAVEFRKGDKKICFNDGTQEEGSSQVKPASVDIVEFDQKFVMDQIGPGFANILNSHKLIPEIQEGKSIGFKMIGILPGSLLEKAKFQNDDILTDVNTVSLSDPSQGFRLYQALQEEREVTVKLVRKGEPTVIKVLIK